MRSAAIPLLVAAACGGRETPFVVESAVSGAPAEAVAPASDPTAIRIGALFAFESKSSLTEENTFKGISVAVQAVNEAGGIGGRRVEIERISFDGTSQKAVEAARRAVDRGVVAVLGPSWSNPALAAAPILDEAKVPMIVTLATNPEITKGRPWVFRISSDDRAQAQGLAAFAHIELRATSFATVVDVGDTASLSLTALFVDEMTRQGCNEALRVEYTSDQADDKLAALWGEILARAPPIVFLPLKVRDVGRVMRAGRAAGFTGTFVGGDGWGNIELLAAAGKAALGSYFASHWDESLDVDTSLEFFEAYVNLHKSRPTLGSALGYDAARVLLDTIRRVGTDRAGIRDALAAIDSFPATTGPLAFDADRSARRPVVILRVDLARFVPHKVIPPKEP